MTQPVMTGAPETSGHDASARPDIVRVRDGMLRGTTADGVTSFRGIPFARPPIGPLRWQPPQPPEPWAGERAATAYRSDSMQQPFDSEATPLGVGPAEDSLYLNVWRPQAATGDRLPVLFWIHGGAFMNGGSSTPNYSGAALARDGIVFVSANYRLGRFGWFAHPRLTEETPAEAPLCNYGMMDQVAALRWVRDNIAAFGGDPDDVTIMGESAGGGAVHLLMASPVAAGLFHKAVIQSGGDGELPMGDLAGAERAGIAFAEGKGIAADDPEAMARLRALPAEAVVDGLTMAAVMQPPAARPTFTMPVVDGRLAVRAADAYRAGRFNRVPVMIGATSDDLFGPDGPMMKGARDVAALLAGQGVPVYSYLYDYVADSVRASPDDGAQHAAEVPFFFRTIDARFGARVGGADRAASALASGYLLNFVRTGDPNGHGLPTWPLRSAERDAMLVFTAKGDAEIAADG